MARMDGGEIDGRTVRRGGGGGGGRRRRRAAAASGSGRTRGATGGEDARNTIARDRETTGSVGDGTIAIATVAWSRVSAAASVREGLARGLRRAAIASRERRDAMKPPGIATVADSAVVRARTPGVDAGRPRRLVEGRDRGRRLVAATNDAQSRRRSRSKTPPPTIEILVEIFRRRSSPPRRARWARRWSKASPRRSKTPRPFAFQLARKPQRLVLAGRIA